jgi:hypothetical protein
MAGPDLMVSLIDPTVPIYGRTPGPSTLSVRTNFQHAKDEVEALQNTRLHRSAGPTNPLTGPLFLFNEPIGAPTVAVRSPGTRIVLFNGLTATTFDYALGIENNTLWFSANGFFRWYLSTASNNPVATLDNTGLRLTGRLAASELEARGTTSAASSLRLAGVAGTQGIRVNHAPGFSTIEGVDNSFTATYETLRLYGARLQLGSQGGAVNQIDIQGNNIAISSATTFGNFVTVRHGANPGITIENTGAVPTFGVHVGGNPATLWFRTVNSATNVPIANLAGLTGTGKFTLYGAQSDPFEITVPSGMSARAWFTITGTRTWSIGPRADGAFEIADQTGTIGRMVIGTGGLMQYFGDMTLNGILQTNAGLGPPIADGRSIGTRLVLFPGTGTAELAIGIMSGGMWFSTRGTTDFFAWYSAEVEIARLHGTGRMTIGADPINPLDVATKRYVDGAFDDLRDATETRLAALEARIAHMGV